MKYLNRDSRPPDRKCNLLYTKHQTGVAHHLLARKLTLSYQQHNIIPSRRYRVMPVIGKHNSTTLFQHNASSVHFILYNLELGNLTTLQQLQALYEFE